MIIADLYPWHPSCFPHHRQWSDVSSLPARPHSSIWHCRPWPAVTPAWTPVWTAWHRASVASIVPLRQNIPHCVQWLYVVRGLHCVIDYCLPVSDVVSRQHLRSASRRLLVVPRHCLSTYGRRAFAVAGPTAWNSFPDNLRDPDLTTENFKRLLKTFFVLSVPVQLAY